MGKKILLVKYKSDITQLLSKLFLFSVKNEKIK